MAEPVGGLFVRFSADFRSLVDGFKEIDKGIKKFDRAVTQTAKGVASMAVAFGAAAAGVFLFAKRQSDMLDELAKTSQKIGVTVESLSALKHGASLAGVSFDQLTVGLRMLSKNMADMQAGTGEAKEAFIAMGLSVEESQGKLKGTEAMLLEVAERFSKMEDGAGKTALAMRIFGRAGADLIPFLNEGRAGIEKLRIEAERLGLVFSTEAAKAAEEFNDNVERLQGSLRSMEVQLAGPIITALNNAALAFLNARTAGMDFTDSLREMFGVMVFGTDINRLERDLFNLTESQLKAQKKLDQANRVARAPGQSGFGERLRIQAQQELDEINRQIEETRGMLNSMRKLEEDARKPKTGGRRTQAPPLDSGKKDDLITKQLEEAAEEEIRIQAEAAQASADFRADELRRRQVAAQLGFDVDTEALANLGAVYVDWRQVNVDEEKAFRDERLRIIMEAGDREQEEAIRRGEEELAIDKSIQQRKKQAQATFFDNLSGLMNTNNKKMFEIGKKVALSRAAVAGAQAVMDAWRSGMETGGPWAPLVAAAYAAAAAVNAANMINNIRSQQFGGGGGTPVAPTQGSSGVSPVGAGGAGPQGVRGPDTIINLQGDTFSTKQLRELFDRLNEGRRDGGRFILA